jgi:hypothetical protein
MTKKNTNTLPLKKHEELLKTLKPRFEKNLNRYNALC